MIDYFLQLCKSQLGVIPVKEYVFHSYRRWRFDYAFVDYKIALEVEGGVFTGGRHINPCGFLKDMDKYNSAAQLGWRVLRCTPDALCTMRTIDLISKTIKNGSN